MVKYLLVCLILLFFHEALPQSLRDMEKEVAATTTRVTLAKGDSLLEFSLMTPPYKINLSDNRYYWWYARNELKSTQGGFSGKPLHGPFVLYYANKDLKQKGAFTKALRTGKWITWYPNGAIARIETWKKGLREGRFEERYPNGKPKLKGEYKNDLYNGIVMAFETDGTVLKRKYRNGVMKERPNEGKDVAPKPEQSTVKQELRQKWDRIFKEKQPVVTSERSGQNKKNTKQKNTNQKEKTNKSK